MPGLAGARSGLAKTRHTPATAPDASCLRRWGPEQVPHAGASPAGRVWTLPRRQRGSAAGGITSKRAKDKKAITYP